MREKKLTFIVGAGASFEYNLPLGSDLKDKIARSMTFELDSFQRLISGDNLIVATLSHLSNGVRTQKFYELSLAAKSIANALPLSISIDNYINSKRGNELIEMCGKIGIVKNIIDAESHSSLRKREENSQRNLNFKSLEETWIAKLFKILTEDKTLENIGDSLANITLVVFNYDRCIEQFLANAFQVYYNIPESRAFELLSNIKIIHPYGALGSLVPHTSNYVGFGDNIDSELLINISKNIKTFSEGTSPEHPEIETINSAIAESDVIAFIGFAYHPINMKFLIPAKDSIRNQKCRIIGSAFGLSDSDCYEITKLLESSYSLPVMNINISNKIKSAGVFHEYGRILGRDW